MMNQNLAVFDLDGVILESVHCKTVAFRDLYQEFGTEIQNKVEEHHLRNGGISRYEKIKFYHENFLNIKLSEKEFEKLINKFSELVLNKVINSNLVKGVEEFLQNLLKDHKIVLSTGTPTSEAIFILKQKKIDHYFSQVFGSPMSKVEHMKDLLNTKNYENKYFFGDAITDYEAAKIFNMKFVLRSHNKNKFMNEIRGIYKTIKNFENLSPTNL